MKRYLAGIGVFFALFSTALISQSQVQNGASISGVISDRAGAVISNAPVELRASNVVQFRTTSDAQGRYEFLNLKPATYDLSVAVAGFKTYMRQKLPVAAGQRVGLDIMLEIGSSDDSVTVTSDSTLLRTESGELARNMGRSAVVNGLPMGLAQGGYAPPPPKSTGVIPYQLRAQMSANDRAEIDHRDREYRGRYTQPNNEEYGHFVENEFTTPTADPLSTFGVDVDTASYSNTRRFLNDRQLPPPESVRIEELINYFSYDYPLPKAGDPVSMTTHLMTSPWNSHNLLLHVGLRTQPIAAEDLPPSSLTFLIDVSGSMSPSDRLPLIQQALQMLVRQLRPQDRVSLVVYAGNTGVVLPPTSGRDQQTILDAIGRLSAGGSTNGAAGIRLAYQMARQAFLAKGNNRVILATDGDFNVGVQSDEELVRLIEQERKSGVFLSVFGVGRDNLKDSKMEKLADHGNGTYAYLDSLSEARKVFVQELGATVVTVAKDVKLQIEFNPARVREYRLVGYENRLLRPEDFNDDRKDAGDLGAGHQVTAFYEIIPVGNEISQNNIDSLRYQDVRAEGPLPQRGSKRPNEVAWVKMRFKSPQDETSELRQWPVAGAAIDFRQAPKDVRFAASVAEYGMLLRRSKFAGSANFADVLRTANDTVGADLAGYRTEFLDLVRKASQLSQR